MSQRKKSVDSSCCAILRKSLTQLSSVSSLSLRNDWSETFLGSFSVLKFYDDEWTLDNDGRQLSLTILFSLYACRQKVRLPKADVVQPGPETLHAEVLAPLLGLQL